MGRTCKVNLLDKVLGGQVKRGVVEVLNLRYSRVDMRSYMQKTFSAFNSKTRKWHHKVISIEKLESSRVFTSRKRSGGSPLVKNSLKLRVLCEKGSKEYSQSVTPF